MTAIARERAALPSHPNPPLRTFVQFDQVVDGHAISGHLGLVRDLGDEGSAHDRVPHAIGGVVFRFDVQVLRSGSGRAVAVG